MSVVGLIAGACMWSRPAQAAIFTAYNAPGLRAGSGRTTQHAQLLEQELQDWRQRRDAIDAQIAAIDIRLKEPTLTEADRQVLEDRSAKLELERKDVDEWIRMIFERLIHVP